MILRRIDIFGRVAIAFAVFAAWLGQFGLLGSDFSADTSLAAVMALRPFAATSLYVWGEGRQGMLVPLATRFLHLLLGLPALPTAQLLTYFCSAVALYLAMGMLESWPLRLALALFFGCPSVALAQSLCNPMYHLPLALLLSIGQVDAFRTAARDPGPLRIAWAAMLGGLLLWAAENCVVLFPAEVWIVGIGILREPRSTFRRAAAAAAGVALPAAIIVIGKSAVHSSGIWDLVPPERAIHVAAGLAPQLNQLIPALGGAGMYLLIAGLSVLAIRRLWALRGRPLADVSPLAVLGSAPLLGLIGTSFSHHFEMNLRMSRYLAWPAVIAVIGGCLALGELLAGARSRAPIRRGPLAAALTFGALCLLGHARSRVDKALVWGNDFGGPEPQIVWHDRVEFLSRQGCQGVIGNHWDVYPLMALTDGRILASPIPPGAGVLDERLAFETVRQQAVCRVQTSRPGPGACRSTETFFGESLRLQDEVRQEFGGQVMSVCRFKPEPFKGFCTRAADLPETGDVRILSGADGAGARVVELRQGIRFGPYLGVGPGEYRYVTRLSVVPGSDPGPSLQLDVFSGTLDQVLAKRELTASELPTAGSWRLFSLPFTLTSPVTDLELRSASEPGARSAFREDWVGLFPGAAGPQEGEETRTPACLEQ
jgi:hypothetical protein